MMNELSNGSSPVNLKRFMQPQPPRALEERCELCGAEIAAAHSHVVNLDSRALLCACRSCYLLFTHGGAGGGRFKAAPERYQRLSELRFSSAQWDRLQIPVGVAFFFFNSSVNRIAAFYPSPAGATESLLPLEMWGALVTENPLLSSMAADVEALLLRNLKREGMNECYIVPIDACYELVGRIRLHWKGFDGGEKAWQEIDSFFGALRARCENDDSAAAAAE
jgi:hypothetical protein